MAQIRDVVDLTLANELEIALSAGDAVARDPASSWIRPFVSQLETRASPGARHGVHRLLDRLP